MAQTSFIAFPFIYQAGDRFTPRQPNSTGISDPSSLVFVGKGVSIAGVALLAPHYRPVWFWQLWERKADQPVALDPIDEQEDIQLRRRLDVMFSKSSFTPAEAGVFERDLFGLAEGDEIGVQFEASESEVVRNFLR